MPEIFKHSEAPEPPTPESSPVPSSGGPLSALMIRPNGVRFETQESKEQILLLMRAHPITTFGRILATLILIVLPSFLIPLILRLPLPGDLPSGYFLILPLIWYLGTFGYAFTSFLHWYFNIYIVTDERVIDIDWIGLLYKRLSSTQLEKIQDVTYKQGGVLDSFFDFGTVFIQTAGTEENFEFENVPRPERVVREINSIIEKKQTTSEL